jgi:PIN domain nuclease of toxin-antitoxin system
MRFLLDTHTFIWFVTDSQQLSTTAKALIEDEYNEKWLSVASVWEMAIKCSIGKLTFNLPLQTFVEQQIQQNSIDLLSIQMPHLAIVAALPLYHRDPFDRLLIAQAITEGIPIISADVAFDAYSIGRSW